MTFDKLRAINVNEHTEQKDGLTYLSWAWAWDEVKKAYPDAVYKVWTLKGRRADVYMREMSRDVRLP